MSIHRPIRDRVQLAHHREGNSAPAVVGHHGYASNLSAVLNINSGCSDRLIRNRGKHMDTFGVTIVVLKFDRNGLLLNKDNVANSAQ